MKGRILVVDDEEVIRKALQKFLAGLGYEVIPAGDAIEATHALQRGPVDAALIDLMMPRMSGIDLVKQIQRAQPETVCIIMTGYGTIPSAVEAIRAGAFHYVTKPFELDDIAALLEKGLEHRHLKQENHELRRELRERYRFVNVIGVSEPIQELFVMVRKVADSDSTILITGESGTGKELFARAIHYHSRRADQPLVPVNCGAIPETLLETELFGHVKGAFTGAIATRLGRFEMADGGTIFLDEIGEMSPKLQVKVLRVLQERKFEPVGSTQTKEVDVRIIAATNKDLEKEVAAGRFREDLFYRLNVIPLEVPPLRERKSDIPLLIDHFLAKFNEENGKRAPETRVTLSAEARQRLMQYPWPGNVRELENLVERLVVLKGQGEVAAAELPPAPAEEAKGLAAGSVQFPETGVSLKGLVDDFETELIQKALTKTGGNKNKAAALLRVNRTTLVEKIKKKGLEGWLGAER